MKGRNKMKRLEFDKVEFFKHWFVFPFCISISDCYVRNDVKAEIQLHFLFWHTRIFILRKVG